MLVDRSPLFHLYKEYSEYKFYFRKSHENFATFIQQYEQMRQKIDENIFMKCSRLQIQILDLLAVSNLASDEDVETVISSLENLKAVDNIYEKVKESIGEISAAFEKAEPHKIEVVEAQIDYEFKPTIWDEYEDTTLPDDGTIHDYNENPQKMEGEECTVIKFTHDNQTKLDEEAKHKQKRKGGRQKTSKRKKVEDTDEETSSSGDDDDYVLPPHHRKNVEVDGDTDTNLNEVGNDDDEVKTRSKVGRPRINPIIPKSSRAQKNAKNREFIRGCLIESPDGNQFTCKQCGNVFKERNSFIWHVKNYHIGNKPLKPKRTVDGRYICDGCGKNFADSVLLKRHKLTDRCGNIDNLAYACKRCTNDRGKPLQFDNWKEYRKHRRDVHDYGKQKREKSKELVQCDECDKMVTRLHLPIHKRSVHLGIKVQCPDCGEMIIEEYMRRHRYKHEAKLKSEKGEFLQCDQCDFKTALKSSLTDHIRQKHNKVPEYVACDICGKVKATKGELEAHIKNVHGERLQCPYCPKYFAPNGLQPHIQARHKTTNNICVFCNFESTDSNALQDHMKIEHPYEVDVPKEAKPKKVYTCEFNCGFTCFNIKILGSHRRFQHTAEKIKCDQCEFTTVFPNNMKMHKERVHLGIRHPCKHCDFTSTSKGGVKAHMLRKHPDLIQLYSCHMCNYRTESKELLTRHLTGEFGKHGTRGKRRADLYDDR